MKEIHILNLGAGVQSTMVYMLATMKHPKITEFMPKVDFAIFADTGEEPERVYQHLEWIKGLGGPEILTCSKGRLGDDLVNGCGPTKRSASMPVFTNNGDGRTMRQCSAEYKVAAITKCIRETIVGLKPGERFPKNDVHVHQYFGLSFDEPKRVLNVRHQFMKTEWATPHFPLFGTNTDRAGCKMWLKGRVPHEVPRSACVFCPCHDNAEWRWVLNNNPWNPDWIRAVEIDEALRDPKSACSRGMRELAYLHRSCVPLSKVDLSETTDELYAEFDMGYDCMGLCGV